MTRGSVTHTPLTLGHVASRLVNPNIVGLLMGLVIAMVPGLADVFFPRENLDANGDETTSRAPLGFVTSGAKTLGSAGVGAVTLVVAATLGKRIEKMTAPVWATQASRLARSVSVAMRRRASRMRGVQGDAAAAAGGGSSPLPRRRRLSSARSADISDDGIVFAGENFGRCPTLPPQEDFQGKGEYTNIGLSTLLEHAAGVRGVDGAEATPLASDEPCLVLPAYGETDVDGLALDEDAEELDDAAAAATAATIGEAGRATAAAPVQDSLDAGSVSSEEAAHKGAAGQSQPPPPQQRQHRASSATVMTTLSAAAEGDRASLESASTASTAEEEQFHLSKGRIALMVFGRVIVVGLLEFLLVFALSDYIFTGPDAALVKLVLYIQAFTPTASMAVVGCQHAGAKQAAETIAVAMVFQWLAVFVVLIFSAAVAFSLTYPEG